MRTMDVRTPRAAVLLGALLASSTIGGLCGPSPAPPAPGPSSTCTEGAPPADGQPMIELSDPETGATLEEGHTLLVEHGAQGGSHFMVAARQYSTSAGTWTYTFTLVRILPDGTEQEDGSNNAAVEACGPGWTATTSPVFLYGSAGPGTLRVRAENGGATLTDEVMVNLE